MMGNTLKSEIERYLQLAQQGSATQDDWEGLIKKITREELERLLEGTWGLTEKEREEFLKSPAEVPDPYPEAYIKFVDYIPEWVCSKCGYNFLDSWEEVIYSKGDAECEHELRLSSVLHRIPLEFDEKGKVPESVIKKATLATRDLLRHHIVASQRVGSRPGEQPSYLTLNNRPARRSIIDFYTQFKLQLASKPLLTELAKLIETYDPDLVRRVVRLNARSDIVDKGIIKHTRNTANRKKYAWCLAVFKVASQNPNVANVPGIGAIERNSYPSRSKKTP